MGMAGHHQADVDRQLRERIGAVIQHERHATDLAHARDGARDVHDEVAGASFLEGASGGAGGLAPPPGEESADVFRMPAPRSPSTNQSGA